MSRIRHPGRAPEETDAFISRHSYIVVPIAERLVHSLLLPPSELPDAIQTGSLGLVKAAQSYRPERGTEYWWARYRVREEILKAYLTAPSRHSGGDDGRWATHRESLTADLAAPPASSEPPGLPAAVDRLPDIERRLMVLMFEDGYSLRAVAKQRLLGFAGHKKSRKRVSIGWRRAQMLYADALRRLQQELRPAA